MFKSWNQMARQTVMKYKRSPVLDRAPLVGNSQREVGVNPGRDELPGQRGALLAAGSRGLHRNK